ncbi:unnamed protein product [Ixodes hexagonus]
MSRFPLVLVLCSCIVAVSLCGAEARSRTRRASLPSAVGRLLEVPIWARRAGKALTGRKPSVWGRLGCLDRMACILGATVREAGDAVRSKSLLPAAALQGHQSAFAKGLGHGNKSKCRLTYACLFKKGPAGLTMSPTPSVAVGDLSKAQVQKYPKKTNSKKNNARRD